MVLAVAHPNPWSSASFYPALFSVSRRFSLQPSCHLAVVPPSSFSPRERSVVPSGFIVQWRSLLRKVPTPNIIPRPPT